MTVEIPIRPALAYSLGTLVASIVAVAASGTTEAIAGAVLLLLQIAALTAIVYYRRHPAAG